MTRQIAEGERPCRSTPEEMLAIEQAARRERARAIAGLLAATGRQLKELIRRTDAAPRISWQFPTRRKAMTTLFWKNALASLPPEVQRRYAATFEAAERFEMMLDQAIEAWGSAKHALGKIFRAAAHAMRRAARILDSAAHRLFRDPSMLPGRMPRYQTSPRSR